MFLDTPAIENGWQGKPATRISKSGMEAASICWMSPAGFSPKFASYVICANVSHSDEKTHLQSAF
jgi:hypothetical protein